MVKKKTKYIPLPILIKYNWSSYKCKISNSNTSLNNSQTKCDFENVYIIEKYTLGMFLTPSVESVYMSVYYTLFIMYKLVYSKKTVTRKKQN